MDLVGLMFLGAACSHKGKTTGENYSFERDSLLITQLDTLSEDTLDVRYGAELLPLGAKAPAFTMPVRMPQRGDAVLTLDSLRGMYVVLDFWASWCPDCRRELPEVLRMEEENNLPFVGISFDTDGAQLDSAIAKYEIPYPQVTELCRMKESRVAQEYGVRWIPTYYLISPDGRVLMGTVVLSRLERALKAIKQEKPAE